MVVEVFAFKKTLRRDARRVRLDMILVNKSRGNLVIVKYATPEGGDDVYKLWNGYIIACNVCMYDLHVYVNLRVLIAAKPRRIRRGTVGAVRYLLK